MATARIDRALVFHMADLAALRLTDEEAEHFAGELARIVAYFEQLDTLDVREVPPTAHVQLDRAPWRDDEPQPGLTHEDATSQAPQVEDGGFVVPTFVE